MIQTIMRSRQFPRIVVIMLLIVQCLTHLFWLPISAHSGQTAIPWMMNQGKTLFDDLLEQHAPGSSVLAAMTQRLLPLEPIQVAQITNLAMVLAVTFLTFVVASRLSGSPVAGLCAALFWFWWEPVYGNVMLYFDSLVGFLLLSALAVWLAWGTRRGGTLATGILLGMATLAKQHAWLAVVLFAGWLILTQQRRAAVMLIAGALIFPALAVIVVTLQGNLDSYLYWNWGFNLSGLMVNDPLSGDFLRKLLLTNAFAPAFWILAMRQRDSRGLLVGLMWLAGSATLIPRPGEVHAMGQLPLLAVMSGIVLATLIRDRWTPFDTARGVLAGMLAVIVLAWMWTGGVAYLGNRGEIPAYDEFVQLAENLQALSESDDTLFVLPETDSTPQIHLMSGLLPPGTWIKGWFWYLAAPGTLDTLMNEWASRPPTLIVYFPDLISEGMPDIQPLVDFMNSRYEQVALIEDVRYHGDALIYHLR